MRHYDLCVLTYLDILGFGKLIERKNANEIHKILSSFKRLNTPQDDDPEDEPLGYKFSTFSDLVVRSIPVPKGGLEWALNFEIACLAYIQALAAYSGVIIRGAVTVGKIYSDSELVFGPALVRAYELEKKIARFPRIIVDPVIAGRCRRAKEQDVENPVPWDANLCVDSDGLLFIDYLRWAMDEAEIGNDFSNFRSHKKLILRGAKECRVKDSAYEKYIWLMNYHNRMVESIQNEQLIRTGASLDKLIIKRAELTFRDSP